MPLWPGPPRLPFLAASHRGRGADGLREGEANHSLMFLLLLLGIVHRMDVVCSVSNGSLLLLLLLLLLRVHVTQ